MQYITFDDVAQKGSLIDVSKFIDYTVLCCVFS